MNNFVDPRQVIFDPPWRIALGVQIDTILRLAKLGAVTAGRKTSKTRTNVRNNGVGIVRSVTWLV